ncbi:MAG: cytochrome c biogenesis CcdA family protein, partial [Anaerolineales bacterium]
MEPPTLTSTTPILSRLIVFAHAALFVLGFSLVFVIGWGGAATALGQLFGEYKTVLGQIGGAVVILFGLYKLGVVNPWWLGVDSRPRFSALPRHGWLASALMGVFFAAGWTPCIGTTLGAILTLSLSQETTGLGMWLSSGYALGLGLPFLLIGLVIDRAATFVRRFRRYLPVIERLSGIFLIVMGVLMLTGQMQVIAIWALRNGWFIDVPLG